MIYIVTYIFLLFPSPEDAKLSLFHLISLLFSAFILQDKNHRSMVLDCLHRVVRFYLTVYAEHKSESHVSEYLDSVTSQLLTSLKKGMLTQDVQHDKLVEFCVLIAENNFDFFMNHIILELLKPDSSNEGKVIGLRALLAVVTLRSPVNKFEVFCGD